MQVFRYSFLMRNLIVRDFKIRYRNMSLGIFWSLLNPLVMMGVLTFIFTKIFPNPFTRNFGVFVLCGLVPYNFFAVAWVSGTTSLLNNASLVKRVRLPREVVPVSVVLANGIHFLIQIALLLAFVLGAGYGLNRNWLWLPFIFGLEVVFVCGLSLASSAMDVFFRDVRYVVESINTVLFWLVPIFYSFAIIPEQYKAVYQFNPVAAVVMACRLVLLENRQPPISLLWKLAFVSTLAVVLGWLIFRRSKQRFADYL
ncbi:MAG: ABC transporter permease [Bryobacteraceae bacterium]